MNPPSRSRSGSTRSSDGTEFFSCLWCWCRCHGAELPNKTTMVSFLPVAILSYGWASKAHPDPDGRQLREVLAASGAPA